MILFLSVRVNNELIENMKAVYPLIRGEKQYISAMYPHNEITKTKITEAIRKADTIVVDDYIGYLAGSKKRTVQLWHASGAFKQFASSKLPCAKAIVSSEYCRPYYARAFNIAEKDVVATGIPKTDWIFNEAEVVRRKKTVRDKYNLTGRVILYAPTFRDNARNSLDLPLDIDFEGTMLISKHPIISDINISGIKSNIMVCNERTDELMAAADVMITDYSSIAFDWMLTGKPIGFYAYDLKEYVRGFWLDYSSLPNVVTTSKGLERLLNTDMECDYSGLVDRYMNRCDGHASERVAELIEG
jgi:CDP-ribitol ribitolphosphotransferase